VEGEEKEGHITGERTPSTQNNIFLKAGNNFIQRKKEKEPKILLLKRGERGGFMRPHTEEGGSNPAMSTPKKNKDEPRKVDPLKGKEERAIWKSRKKDSLLSSSKIREFP